MPYVDLEVRRIKARAYSAKWRDRNREFVRVRDRTLSRLRYAAETQLVKKRAWRCQFEARAWLHRFKATQPCSDCGGYYPAVAMDFDHVGPVKNRAVGEMRSIPAMLGEMALCELVCSNCHRIRGARRGRWLTRHGGR